MINVVNLDDWIVIYKDGKSIFQGHSIRAEELLNILNVTYFSEWKEISPYDNIPEFYDEWEDDEK